MLISDPEFPDRPVFESPLVLKNKLLPFPFSELPQLNFSAILGIAFRISRSMTSQSV